MTRFFNSIVFMALLVRILMAQESSNVDINVSGKVTDISGKAVPQAIVTLKTAKISDTTDNLGSFSLVRNASSAISKGFLPTSGSLSANVYSNQLYLHLPNQSAVLITVHSLNGSLISTRKEQLNAGNHTLAMPPAPEGMWFYTVKAGNEQFTFKSISINNTRRKNIYYQSSSLSSGLAKRTVGFDDTLTVTKDGYNAFSIRIDNPVKSGIEIKLSPKTAVVPPSELIGWAKTDKCGPKGTTGGGDGPPTVVVTTTSELVAALSAAGPKVIEVRGQMKGAHMKDGVGVKDKTLIGTNGAFISDGMRIDKGHNIIVRNIRFGESKVVGGNDNLADGFTVHNTTCIWIDHCEFTNSIDGNLDIVGGDGFMSSWVTVSWSKFWYDADYAANVNKIHRFSNLIVGSDDKPDPLPYVTYHHNWWAENVTERMPRGRWAWAHVFNNYYSTQGNNYGIGLSVGIQFVVENNFFEPGFEDPVYFFNKDKGVAVRLTGNQMDGVVWKDTKAENAEFGTAFNPADHYSYTLQSPADAKASVIAGAGRK